MKLRSGFVSNSSSSSFAIIGVPLKNILSVTKADLNEYEEIVCTADLDGNEGSVLLHISDEKYLKFVQEQVKAGNLALYDVYGSYGSGEIKTDNLPKGKKLILESWNEDQCSPGTIEDLKEWYLDNSY